MSHEDSSRVRKVHLLTLGQPRILIYIVQKLSGLVPVAKALLKIVPARAAARVNSESGCSQQWMHAHTHSWMRESIYGSCGRTWNVCGCFEAKKIIE